MKYSIQDIATIISAKSAEWIDCEISEVAIDSRKIGLAGSSLFIALPGTMKDGHEYISQAYQKGVRSFVITRSGEYEHLVNANFLIVDDAVKALQSIAKYHRENHADLNIIGITGSNGKTIVKEWLYQMLHDRFHVVKSPKSYNSQIGVALSILNIENQHELGIFEVGISEVGEMQNHHQMLAPNIGLITNIGNAHNAGFNNHEEKAREKMALFQSSDIIIHRSEKGPIKLAYDSHYSSISQFCWGSDSNSDIEVISSEVVGNYREIFIGHGEESVKLKFRFLDLVAFENIMHCISLMVYLDIPLFELQDRISRVSGLDMRLKLTSGIQNSILVNDAYSADLDSLKMALEFTTIHAPDREKTAILSPFDQSGVSEEVVFEEIVKLAKDWFFTKVIYISEHDLQVKDDQLQVSIYPSKQAMIDDIINWNISNCAILIKGARRYAFEDVVSRLSDKGHSAILTINISHIESNLRVYKRYLKQETGIIAVIKASAYGSGSTEVAQLLEQNGVEYLAVAFADEGVALRKAGIGIPIMILNPDLKSLADLIAYNLEPEVYSIQQLKDYVDYCEKANQYLNIHLKLDTGMHRLGFVADEMVELIAIIKRSSRLNVRTVFSHLASSEDSTDDTFTKEQFATFEKLSSELSLGFGSPIKRHILNSGGITRFPEKQYDLVRLGIGMYGIDNNKKVSNLLNKVHSLTANVIQIKDAKAGQSIGYNRKTILKSDAKIAIVNIGYADGLMRNLGNRNYHLYIGSTPTPILGNVCMDLTIIDVSEVEDIRIGDEVIIFNKEVPIEILAEKAETIPYEILSRISDRVQRRFVKE